MSAADMFWAAPPIARTITAAAVLISVPAYVIGFPNLFYLAFIPQYVFTLRKIPQLWRLFTNFLITGDKLGLILDPYFLFTYCSALETTATRFSQGPGDFVMYLLFCCVVIVLTGGVYFGTPMLLSPLTLALAYTYAQENPQMQLNYFIITFSAKWLPYAMLAMTFVMASPQAALIQSTGLIAAHAYDFLAIYWPQYGGGPKLIQTPAFVANAFAPLAGGAGGTRRGAGTAFNTGPRAAGGASAQNVPQRPAGGSGAGWASGFSGGAWGERGPGRRLGGD